MALRSDAQHHSQTWRKYRLYILSRDNWTCQMCGTWLREGKRHNNAATADHIIPAELRPDLFYEDTNVQAVCKTCHDRTCQAIEKRHAGNADAIAKAKRAYRPVGLDGYPI